MALLLHIHNPQLSLPNLGDVQSARPITQDARQLPEAVSGYIAAALANNTRQSYQGDLQDFLRWGGAVPCTPETLAAYIADRAEIHSPHTITRRVVGISRAHVSQGLPDPAKNDLVGTV